MCLKNKFDFILYVRTLGPNRILELFFNHTYLFVLHADMVLGAWGAVDTFGEAVLSLHHVHSEHESRSPGLDT